MNFEDIKSLSEKTREDGRRLFGVCEFIYKISLILIWFIGIAGGISALTAMFKANFWVGFGIAVFVFLICFFYYIVTVLFTHIAKVMVHTSFTSVAILEHLTKSEES
jgi:hypothetical protein